MLALGVFTLPPPGPRECLRPPAISITPPRGSWGFLAVPGRGPAGQGPGTGVRLNTLPQDGGLGRGPPLGIHDAERQGWRGAGRRQGWRGQEGEACGISDSLCLGHRLSCRLHPGASAQLWLGDPGRKRMDTFFPTETGELPLQATASQSNLLGSSLPQ